ncbi:MAG: DUF1405 domain-containing protein [Candidatus Nanosalina sp.]
MELEKIRDLIYSRKVLFSAVLINLAGTAFGFYYYAEQLASTSLLMWIFIPDSPLSTLAAAAAFFLYIRGKQNYLIETFAFFGNLKYGVWTVFVLLYMQSGFLQYQPLPLYIFLIASHALMVLQAFVILDLSEISWKPLAAVLTWFLVNDAVDYTLGTHSTLPHSVGFSSPVAWVAVATTLAAGAIVYSEKIKTEDQRSS